MSQLEAESILKKASQVRNVQGTRGKLVQPAVRILSYRERQNLEMERDRIKAQIDYRGPGGPTQDQRKDALKYYSHLEDRIENESPPPLTGDQKNAVYRRKQELEAFIQQGMLTHEEMRRNPVGAVDRHIKWERRTKDAIKEWKNHCRLLDPESDEQDLANVERLRPTLATSGVQASSTYMPEAQIPGQFGMTPLAKQNWPEGMPEYGTVNSPFKQAEDREKEELKARLAEIEAKLKEAEPAIQQRQKMLDGLAKARAIRDKKDEARMIAETNRLRKLREEEERKQAQPPDEPSV